MLSIALVGRFCIGTSFLVRMLAQLFERDLYSTVIVFNVWVHRSAVLRRAFMKVLLEMLTEKKWISPAGRDPVRRLHSANSRRFVANVAHESAPPSRGGKNLFVELLSRLSRV